MDILNPTSVAILSGIFVGSLAKLIDWRAKSESKKADIAKDLRDDLWQQNQELEKRVKDRETECDGWKKRYYDQYELFVQARTSLRKYESKYGALDASESSKK